MDIGREESKENGIQKGIGCGRRYTLKDRGDSRKNTLIHSELMEEVKYVEFQTWVKKT